MATAFDECEESRVNGGGCAPLQDTVEEQRRIRARQDNQASRLAQLTVTVDYVKDAVDRVEQEAKRTADAIDAVRTVVCSPANALLKYHSSTPPPELLDGGDDIPTDVAIRHPALSEQRIHREKTGRLEAEKRAEALGAEKERFRVAAKLEAARIAEAAKLKEEQVEREKRNTRLLHAGLGVLMSLITFLTTWLASRGH